MDALTLDQFVVFIAIVEEGSFAAAARRLGRAQSAVTYAVQKLEDQSRVVLFDRSAYRPVLTEAGRTLLPRARRIIEGVADYRLQASGIAKGLEAQLNLVLDTLVPASLIAPSLKLFHDVFPLVQLRIGIEWNDVALRALSEDLADLVVIIGTSSLSADFIRDTVGFLDLVPVAAAGHPLAQLQGPIETERLWDHLQLVVKSRSSLGDQRDYGVQAANRWYVTDFETKHRLLLAGVGWGSLPLPTVADDIAQGRLVELHPTRWEGADQMPRLRMVVAYHKGKALGPAGRWLAAELTTMGKTERDVFEG